MQIICDDPGRVWVQDMTNPSRPPGRPRHGIEGIKRSPLTLHITEALKDALRHEAQASGRSLTQEVEYRARWSLSEHRLPERRVTELRLEMVLYEIGELVKENWWNPEIAAAAYRRELLIRPRKSKSPRNSRSRRP